MAHDVMIYPRAIYIVPLGALLVSFALLICFFVWVVLSVQTAFQSRTHMVTRDGMHA